MRKDRATREVAGFNGATSRTARLLRTVANELGRFGVIWDAGDEESAAYDDWWNSLMSVSPADSDYEAVKLNAPRGITGCLLVHRDLLHS